MTIVDEALPDAFFDGDADTAVWNDFSTVIDSDSTTYPAPTSPRSCPPRSG